MPKVLEGSSYKHPHERAIKLFAQPVKGDGVAQWYARITFGKTTPDTKTEQSVRSLKIDYIPNDNQNRRAAEDAARYIYMDLNARREQGLTTKRKNFLALIDSFLKDTENKTEENLTTPIHLIPGGTSLLDKDKFKQIKQVMTNTVRPYFQADQYKNRSIDGLAKKDIEAWSRWRQKLNNKWANGTLNKQNRVFRQFLKWSVDQGYMFAVPEIKDFSTEIRANRRPEMTQGEFNKLRAYLENKFNNETRTDVRVYQRLFYLYILTIDATGIRPFNSEKNAIKHKDVTIKKDKEGKVEFISIKRKEKGIEYTALADRSWRSHYEEILMIQKAHDMDTEYLFAHPFSTWQVNKNDPIKSFDTQWTKAVKALGWNNKGDKQKDRISKYSIRHRYAKRRLKNRDISFEDLAQIMGTSPNQIFETYLHFDTERNYARLTSEGYEERKKKVEYDEHGLPRRNR